MSKHLPPKMRQKTSPNGKTYYYYDTCQTPRKWLPLGSDFYEALRQYAQHEQEYDHGEMAAQLSSIVTFRYVADRYVAKILPTRGLAPRTQRDYLASLKYLLEFFDGDNPAPINAITPIDIYEYQEWRRTAPVRANRELSLFSVIYNWARRWGYTNNENPCRGVEKHRETGRRTYITDQQYQTLYQHAEPHLQHIMQFAALTGQRVADCLKIKLSHIQNGELHITQNKSQTRLRIKIEHDLADLIERILKQRGTPTHDYLFTHRGSKRHQGKPISYPMLRGAMDRARSKAGIDKDSFQFRDLRAKVATDTDTNQDIEAARVLLGHTTQYMTSRYIRHRQGRLASPIRIKK